MRIIRKMQWKFDKFSKLKTSIFIPRLAFKAQLSFFQEFSHNFLKTFMKTSHSLFNRCQLNKRRSSINFNKHFDKLQFFSCQRLADYYQKLFRFVSIVSHLLLVAAVFSLLIKKLVATRHRFNLSIHSEFFSVFSQRKMRKCENVQSESSLMLCFLCDLYDDETVFSKIFFFVWTWKN